MTDTMPPAPPPAPAIPRLPDWIRRGQPERMEDMAFVSGGALALLHQAALSPDLPHALWRIRLALSAAEACAGFAGRRERAADLRDALHLLRPGDHPGPAGEMFRQWSRAVARPVSGTALGAALPDLTAVQIALHLEGAPASDPPLQRACAVLEAVLADAPRAEVAALVLADAVLAKAVGWDHVLPLLATGLKARELRLRGDELRAACHRALVAGTGQALTLAADLSARAARLRVVAPKLRAKGAGRAVALFLSRDALPAAALMAAEGGGLSDRAARRLCDRLVALGALRELSGRDSFRLYGV